MGAAEIKIMRCCGFHQINVTSHMQRYLLWEFEDLATISDPSHLNTVFLLSKDRQVVEITSNMERSSAVTSSLRLVLLCRPGLYRRSFQAQPLLHQLQVDL
jgi:hypothetical protein